MAKLFIIVLCLIGFSACDKPKDDFTINAAPDTDMKQAIPLFKTLVGHCPGIYKYKADIERVEYLGGSSFDLTIAKRPKDLPLDSAPMGHTCHFYMDESKATVSKRPCAWLCTGEDMTGIDGEEHSYLNGKLIGPLKREWVNLREALAGTSWDMTDFNNSDISRGAASLAIWGSKHLTWGDLQKVDQGKYGMIMKDPDSQRGKRLCGYGQIVEIQVDNTTPEKVYWGGLSVPTDDDMRVYRFVAVGSTGELIAGSYAKFCGIITGKNSYQNSLGGVTHAVHLVGMFELPENKKTNN
ncbi:MAG: hypothetical protein PHQ60_06710 [Sideroxydans sp.]|nr:hypothetical protein [Sideroxydans sp.]